MPDSSSRYEHYLRVNAGEFGSMEEFPETQMDTPSTAEKGLNENQDKGDAANETKQDKQDEIESGAKVCETPLPAGPTTPMSLGTTLVLGGTPCSERDAKLEGDGTEKPKGERVDKPKENTVDTKEQSAEAKKKVKGPKVNKASPKSKAKAKAKAKAKGTKETKGSNAGKDTKKKRKATAKSAAMKAKKGKKEKKIQAG